MAEAARKLSAQTMTARLGVAVEAHGAIHTRARHRVKATYETGAASGNGDASAKTPGLGNGGGR